MKHQNILIIFAKNPVYGKVKTRLADSIGADAALKVYEELLKHTNSITQKANADKVIYYADTIHTDDMWRDDFSKAKQLGADLGERMMNAFKEVFDTAYTKAVIVGTDCPALNQHILQDAFTRLTEYDIVLGPAHDGGYYLLGMKKFHRYLFENISWSTQTVFDTTLAICKNNGLSYFLLPVLHDIDEAKDLIHLQKTSA